MMDEELTIKVEESSTGEAVESSSAACLSLDEATCKAASNTHRVVTSSYQQQQQQDDELNDDDDDDDYEEEETTNIRIKIDEENEEEVDDDDDIDLSAAAVIMANTTTTTTTTTGHVSAFTAVAPSSTSSMPVDGSMTTTKTSSNSNLYTFRKTEWDVKKMENYVRQTFNDPTTMDQMSPHVLNTYLKSFFEFAKKSDGMEYEPESLIGFMNSYERYLKTKNYPESLLRSDVFNESRLLLKNKRELVRSIGKLIRTKSKDTACMLQYYKSVLKDRGLLSRDNPDSLLAEIYLNNTIYFGEYLKEDKAWRGNLNLVWGDILLECDPENGLEYLTLSITVKRSSSSKNSSSSSSSSPSSNQVNQQQQQQQEPQSPSTTPTTTTSKSGGSTKSVNRIKTGTQTSKLRAAAASSVANDMSTTNHHHHHHELSSPRVYAREPSHKSSSNSPCPIEAYKLFRARRPSTCLDRESPFYLAPNSKSKSTSKVWYKALAMSCQRLDALFYCLFKKANMDMNMMRSVDMFSHSFAAAQFVDEDVVVWKSNKPVSASSVTTTTTTTTTPITLTQYHSNNRKKHQKDEPVSHNDYYSQQQQIAHNSSYMMFNDTQSNTGAGGGGGMFATVPVQVQVQVQIQVQAKQPTSHHHHHQHMSAQQQQQHQTDFNNNKSLAIY